jgi:Cu-Zn family superoxide dismutase
LAGQATRDSGADRFGSTPGATAELKNAKGETVGTAAFTEVRDGIRVAVRVNGISPGQHGLHIHETGSCVAPDFKSAGEHFNPTKHQHGAPGSPTSHAGDLGNIKVGNDGNGNSEVTRKDLTLKISNNSLLREGGTAIVLHAQADDLKSDPAGNSGDRIACGEIRAR